MKLLGIFIFTTTIGFSQFGRAEVPQQYIRENAVKINLSKNLPKVIAKKVEQYKVITIGEMHGTNETPAFTFSLVKLLAKQNKMVVLGLEIPHGEQEAVNQFLQAGDFNILKNAPFFTRDFQDGRSSKAMASLLERVRHLKNVRVVCFDPAPDDTNGQDRDTKMALTLRADFIELKPSVLVVLAGNIHSSLALGTPWDPNYKPMGYELYSLPDSPFPQSDILAIRLRNLIGSAWVCFEGKPCGESDISDQKSSYSEALSWKAYFLKEPELTRGYNATFFSRAVSASKPLVEKSK